MPLPEFTSETEFQEKWIKPFLSKLGYVLVNVAHGPGEQGKDFFFADFDRFEHRRFYAIQAKRGNIGVGQTELDRLLNQVKRSFMVKLRFHKEADEKHVSAVYIMASGSISREAREYISDWCHKQPFGENVYYLDGDNLERLDKYAFRRVDIDLSSGFALFEGVVWVFRGDVDRGALDRWGLDSRKGSRLGVGQPARLRNSMSWASCFFASLFAKGSRRNLSRQLNRRRVVSMSANEGSFFLRYQGRSGNWR